jgi:MFS transporter, ACS family, L-galactonate transporter
MRDTTLQSRTRRLRIVAVTLLVVAGCVNYLDRAAVSIGNPDIRHDLGLSFGQMGLLLSAFAWSYGLAQIPAGAAVDRFGPRRALGFGLVLWSAAQVAAGGVVSLGQFIAARVALGFGESPMYIGGTRVCADWFAMRDRALPIAIFNSSSALAPALAPPVLTLLMVAFGWRAMFLLAGLAGFAVAIAWVALYRNAGDAAIPATDVAIIHADDGRHIEHAGFRQVLWLLRFRTSWGMFLGFFGVVYVSWLYATWLPGYLETQRHLSIASAGFWSAVPLGAGFAGAVLGGVISDRLAHLGVEPGAACRLPVIWGLIGAAIFTMAGALAGSTGLAIAFIACGLFAANVASSCGWALAAVIAPGNTVATLEAIQNVGGSLGGALAPFITGAVVQATGSFVPALILAGVIALVCALIYGLMARARIEAPIVLSAPA